MGLFDKVKKFAGGKSTANVEIVSINGSSPAEATIKIGESSVRGRMSVTALQDCTMLAMKYEVVLRTQDAQGQWGNITVGSNKNVSKRNMKTGEILQQDWVINGVDIETYLRNQSYEDMSAVPTHPKVKLLVRCTADVEGSPFDPDAEVEVKIGPFIGAPCKIETTVIEGKPTSISSFPVTDSVCKGTVVVTGREPCVLTATRYELWLELSTPNGPVDVLVGKDQNPEIKSNEGGILGIRVSFGGTNISFPSRLSKGEKATQTWSIGDIDLPGKLAAHGYPDARAATTNPGVKFVVRSFADVEGGGVSASRAEIKLS